MDSAAKRPNILNIYGAYADIIDKLLNFDEHLQIYILTSCGICLKNYSKFNIVDALENSVIDNKTNQNCWLKNGREMIDLKKVINIVLPNNCILRYIF